MTMCIEAISDPSVKFSSSVTGVNLQWVAAKFPGRGFMSPEFLWEALLLGRCRWFRKKDSS